MKSVIITLFVFLGLTTTEAQKSKSAFVINVLIDAQKNITIEDISVAFEEVEKVTRSLIYNRAFTVDENLIFKIYSHENLSLGFIMDVENEMAKATNERVQRQRYLLNTDEIYLDGTEWFRKVKELDLKPVNKF